MIPNSANKIVNTTVDITQYINTEYFNVNNGVAYLIKIGKLRMIKVDVTLKKAITKDTYVFNFPSNFLKGMINTYFFGNVINRNGKAYEVAFYNQLASNNFSILLQVTAGNTIENNSRLIGEWTGFCSADINDISEEENKFITQNQVDALINKALKEYTKSEIFEESQSKQDELIQKLQSNTIQESTEEATSLHVEDASDLPARLNVVGNHYQEQQEGTANLAILNEGIIEQNGVTVDIKEGNIKINGTNTTTNTLLFKVGTVKLIEGETYYFKRFGTVNGTGLYVNNSGTQTWGQSSETSFIAKATGTFGIVLTVGTSTINNTIQQILVSKISGRNWIEGKVPIPSVEYPSEISTVKDNIKIIIDNDNSEQKEYNLVVQQEMLQNDKFDLENNKEVHGWKKYTVTSVDNFKVTKKETRFEFEMSVANGNHLSNLVCNMFKKWRTSDYTKTACYIAWNSKFIILLQFGDCGFTESMTVEEAKTRFQEIINENTSLIFYYSMITTEELDLTEEQKQVLNELNNLELFKGVNNIYTEQDLALLQLNYTADTKMYIDNKIASIAGGN